MPSIVFLVKMQFKVISEWQPMAVTVLTGLIYTNRKLKQWATIQAKVAISSSVSYERALDNNPDYKFPSTESNSAVNYTLSVGKLMLPKVYKDYKQTNMNLMLELLGQRLNDNGKSYLDIAPSVQFIINSQARVDIGYRQELYSTMKRTAPNGIVLKFEYTFFNVFK